MAERKVTLAGALLPGVLKRIKKKRKSLEGAIQLNVGGWETLEKRVKGSDKIQLCRDDAY